MSACFLRGFVVSPNLRNTCCLQARLVDVVAAADLEVGRGQRVVARDGVLAGPHLADVRPDVVLRREETDDDNETGSLLNCCVGLILHLLQTLANEKHVLLNVMACYCYRFVRP